MAVTIPVETDNGNRFDKKVAEHGRSRLTEKIRGNHFWPVYTGLLGLAMLFLFVAIIWGLVTGHIKDGEDPDVPPMAVLLLMTGAFTLICLFAAFAHFAHHARKRRYGPAVLNIPDTLHSSRREVLAFSKPLLKTGHGSDQPGELRARLELILITREAPGRDPDDHLKDAQGTYSLGSYPLWQETLRPVPVLPNAHFAGEWEVVAPNLDQLQVKPNALYAQLWLIVEMRRNDREFLEPLRVLLPLA